MHSELQVAQNRKPESGVPSLVRAELEAKLSAGALDLPLLPGVAMEITSAAAREDVDARVIADLLKRDSGTHARSPIARPCSSSWPSCTRARARRSPKLDSAGNGGACPAQHHSPHPELEAVPVRVIALADRFAHFAFESNGLTPRSRERAPGVGRARDLSRRARQDLQFPNLRRVVSHRGARSARPARATRGAATEHRGRRIVRFTCERVRASVQARRPCRARGAL
jgi:hypothetical protein